MKLSHSVGIKTALDTCQRIGNTRQLSNPGDPIYITAAQAMRGGTAVQIPALVFLYSITPP